MKFCSTCGAGVRLRVPPGDTLARYVCDACGAIHYLNPRMVLGCIPVWEDKVLLCKRAIEPRYGFWTLPAGFMENGETLAQAAMRETLEEANARVQLLQLYTSLSVPQVSQVHCFYRAKLLDLDFSAGVESLDVQLFSEAQIPWEEIAYRTVAMTLKYYFEDRKTGVYTARDGDVPPMDSAK
jgi:ADP-ribose pyrophosphatase YjhB (NUDIX family)